MKSLSLPLTVIVLTHNQTTILKAQLDSLERQAGISISDFEVIVTDDSSSDDELAKANVIIGQTKLNCRFLQQKSDRFWAAGARNKGIRVANGRVLLFLDGDMIPEVDVLSKHLALHNGRNNHIVAGHRIRRRLDPGCDSNKGEPGQVLERCRTTPLVDPTVIRWQELEEKKRIEFLKSPHPWRCVFSCHMSVSAAPDVLFDEYFKGWGPEDWEIASRLVKHHGYTFCFAPEIVAYEVDNLGNGVGNLFRLRTQQAIIDYLRNIIHFYDLNTGLGMEEIFWSLRKLQLQDDKWVIVPSNPNCDLPATVKMVRQWLHSHGHIS